MDFRKSGLLVLSTWILLSALTGDGFCSDPQPQQDTIRMNNIVIDKSTREIRIKVKLALVEGILEYLLVEDKGKTYESVFKISDNKASELNFALLLIGCKPLDFKTFAELRQKQGSESELAEKYRESLLEIEIYKEGKKIDFGSLVRNRQASEGGLIWVLTGGYFLEDKRYVGDFAMSQIGIWPDPSAVINLFSNLGNPYQGNLGLEINQGNKELKVDQEYEILIRRR